MVPMRKIRCSLFLFVFICIGTNSAGDDGGINGAGVKSEKKRLQEIREELKHKKAGEKAIIEREESILTTLTRMERDLIQKERKLARLDSHYDQIRKDITSVEKKLNRIQQNMDQNQTRLRSRIVAMYKMGRVGYLPYLLSPDSYTDFMRMAKFLKVVIDYDANLLRNYKAQWLAKRQYQEKLERDVRRLKSIKAEQEGKKMEILNARAEKRTFLKVVRRQKAVYRTLIQELEERESELQRLVNRLEKEAREGGVHGLNFMGHKGRLSLPVSGNIIPGKRGRGILIEAPKGSPIRSVFSGRVIYSGWFEGYGNIIILDHGDKYYTVSAHAAKVLKKANERVAQGEVIALVGDTGSITGPSLYFEIRYQGKPQDPLEWLSIPEGSYGRSRTNKGRATAEGRG